jgi:hypothetical protein
MVQDFQAEEDWPEMERPPCGRRRVALLLYDVCCCLRAPERLADAARWTPKADRRSGRAVELLGGAAWPRIRAAFAPKGGPVRRMRVHAS